MNSKLVVGKDGRSYTIQINLSGTEITVLDGQRNVGTISLALTEGDGRYVEDSFHITSLALDGCKGNGLGRECLKFHHECEGVTITAGLDNGSTSEDGSHLTGDGPGFIQKMREEGLVANVHNRFVDHDDYSFD